MMPPRLNPGDTIRVISPSRDGSIIAKSVVDNAINRLGANNIRVTFSDNWDNNLSLHSAESVTARTSDLMKAFEDDNVKCILTTIGGHNSNQILANIDFEVIKMNPKIFCGFSDITVLLNAIFAKTGMITFLGPHFSSWGMQYGFDYSEKNFINVAVSQNDFILEPSKSWSSDEWYLDQEQRRFYQNKDANIVLLPGKSTGRLIGGNLASFCLLCGTEYMPVVGDAILLIEQSEEYYSLDTFDAQLESILAQDNGNNIVGVLIGRFPNGAVHIDKVKEMIKTKLGHKNIPVIANMNFGHTTPILTLPIGQKCDINTLESKNEVRVYGQNNTKPE